MAYHNNGFDLAEQPPPQHDTSTLSIRSEYSNASSNCSCTEENRPISLAWRNLRYEVRSFCGRKKILLNRLNGNFRVKTLSGLMGPSGAGKTTLLNALAGISSPSGLSSDTEILLPSTSTRPTSCFIAQHVDETIVGRLAVGQILRYAFYFKNSSDKTAFLKGHIEATLRELQLSPDILKRNFEHCSGGEQRRVAIAQELMCLRKPDFLWLDEPTTGLDSSAALEVVRALKSLTQSHQITVVASIHAPNQETLSLFSQLYVLAKGGVCIYAGRPSGIESFLTQSDHHHYSRSASTKFLRQPPVEKLIKIACNPGAPAVGSFAQTVLCEQYLEVTESLSSLTQLPLGLPNTRKYFSFRDLYLQSRRQLRITFLSNYHVFFGQLLFYLVNMLFFSSIFSKDMVHPSGCITLTSSNDTSSSASCRSEITQSSLIYENINFLCFSISVVGFCIISTSTVLFAPVARVFRNEHRNKWYSLSVFFWSTTFTSLLELIALSLTISTSAYFFTGQYQIDQHLNLPRLAHFFFVILLKASYAQAIGQLMGSLLTASSTMALVIANLVYTLIDTFNDFYIKADELDVPALKIFSDLVGMKYINRYLFYIFYGFERCDQSESQFSIVLEKNLVDLDQIGFYITRVLVNVALIKLATLVLFYFKFNTFKICTKLCKSSSTSSTNLFPSMKSLDLLTNFECSDANNNNNLQSTLKLSRSQTSLQFAEFSRHRIILAFNHLTLYRSASSIFASANAHQNSPPILNNLSGYFRFGSLNSLMGMSGAGKTSLLRVLNGQAKSRLAPQTQIYLSKYTRIATCFIAQEVAHHLMPGLTAKQSLVYASRLKNVGVAGLDHEKVAENVLLELSMRDIGETLVQRCSGGERKRLALGLELTSVEMPNLICIDEPTSGLDSNSAEIVIACLRRLTRAHNLTILASIHQPTMEALQAFDQLYVLARGGHCVYSGPPEAIPEHLATSIPEHISALSRCSLAFPIEQLISYSCSGPSSEVVQKLVATNARQVVPREEILNDTQHFPSGILPNRIRFSAESSWILCCRYGAYIWGQQWKEWLAFGALLLHYATNLGIFWPASIATVSGCISLEDVDVNQSTSSCGRSEESLAEEKALQDNLKYNMFMCILFLLFIVIQASLTLYQELNYFINEHRNGWYSTGSWYLTKIIFELLPMFPIILLYLYIVDIYSPVHPGIYLHLLTILILTITATQAFVHIFTLLSKQNFQIAALMFLSVFQLILLLSNFFVSLKRLHYVYQFLANFNHARFALEASLLLQYGFGRCASGQIQPILFWMELSDDHYYYCLEMLVFLIVLYRSIALVVLIGKVNPKNSRSQRGTKAILEHLDRPSGLLGLFGSQELRLKQFQHDV